MSLPNPSDYAGISNPGGDLFFVDGDFTVCSPCGLPEISFPHMGDSVLSTRDIVIYNVNEDNAYDLIPLGTFPNIQPWSPNQNAAILEQEFIVAQNAYEPMNLNTPYNPAWAMGLQNTFTTSYPWLAGGLSAIYPWLANGLASFILVKEGQLKDIGGGLVKIMRTFAVVPPNRNDLEQFTYNYPGYTDTTSGTIRQWKSVTVLSRLQYDYFVFDDLDVLSNTIWPLVNSLTPSCRLDSTTGLYPPFLILQEQRYYSAGGQAAGDANPNVDINIQVDPPAGLDDGTGGAASPNGTTPGYTEYSSGWAQGLNTSNNLEAEIVAEASTMTRWMGNIFERRTRFVIAQ